MPPRPDRSPPATLRIGLFHGTLPRPGIKPGGVDIAVHQLANALSAGGDDVTVLSLAPEPADARYRHRQLAVGSRWLDRSKFFRLYVCPALMNDWGLGSGLDVLHLHGDDWFYFRRTCATVRTMHGSALMEARSATSLKRRVSQRLIYGLEHLAARQASVTVAVGPQAATIYNADGIAGNGIDLARFRPGEKAERPTILFVGTWRGRKRGAFLHDAFVRTIKPQVPDAELIMVCDQCPASQGVRHVVTPDDDTLAELFRSVWVFAFPSVYEGFGIPYLEALASGTVIVTSPNPGASHVLEHGRLGAIVADDVFAETIVRSLRNPAERRAAEISGLAAVSGYAWDRVADTHRAIYRRAIRRWRGG